MMKRLAANTRESLARFRPGSRSVPVFILGVGFLALGLLPLGLGFFQDDWHHVYYFERAGFTGLRQFLFFDSRPISFVTFDALFALLGVRPLGWHVSLFLLRTLTALSFWQALNTAWQGFARENAIVAALFLVYPVYLLQPLSVAYSLHWAMYLVFMLSLWLMLLAARRSGRKAALTAGAVLLQIFHLLMIEYYSGVELLRPVFLWLLYREKGRSERLRQTFRTWLPYLVVDVLYVLYRASYSRIFGYERFGEMTFFTLLHQPLALIAFYLRAGFQDFTEILLASWYATLQPASFDITSISRLLAWLALAAAIPVIWIYLSRLRGEERPGAHETEWAWAMFAGGLLAVLLGILPGWIIGNTVYGSNPLWNDRFALAAMFGAAMTWTGFIYLFVERPVHRYLLFSVLIALAIGINLRTQLDYRQAWERQRNFYWQLAWRAPAIEPGTLLISDGEFLPYMGTNPTTFALNLLYPPSTAFPRLAYWMANGPEHLPDWDPFRAGAPLDFSKYASTFSGETTDSLTISYLPEQGQCLWVLSPAETGFPFLSAGTRETAPVSSLERIRPEPLNGSLPPEQIFGPEPARTWCYYFEKADLAAQLKDWSEAVRLWEQAQQNGKNPGHGAELFPFVRAFAMQGQWDRAFELTLSASRISGRMTAAVCQVWSQLKADAPESASREDAFRQMNDRFDCGL